VNDAGIAKVDLMNDDAEARESLSRTIAEFRAEILRWIDTTLIRLRAQDRMLDAEVQMQEKSAAPASSTSLARERAAGPGLRGGRPTGVRRAAELPAGITRDASRRGGESAELDLSLEPDGAGSATGGFAAGASTKDGPQDSLQRLDALARLLDNRLKVAQESTPQGSTGNGEHH
jgi:hypothetical protein